MDSQKLALIIIIYCISISNVAAETATVVSDSSLYQRPAVQSSIVQQIKAGTTANIDSRLGGWKQISFNDISGWVRSYQVRSGNYSYIKQEQNSGGFFSGLASLSRKASGLFTSNNKKGYSFQNTATIGVRGLSEEQIKNAKADLNELKKMETFRSSRKNSKKYAKQGHLKAIKVSHMPKSGAEK
ncbi:MAG: hypothetical protein KAI17_28040 [Thiotrichaceae bacterium]|nr:hypothetical protein [Thiotrichaceae bacterium]